jgi:hypothetical protein
MKIDNKHKQGRNSLENVLQRHLLAGIPGAIEDGAEYEALVNSLPSDQKRVCNFSDQVRKTLGVPDRKQHRIAAGPC